MSRLSPAYDNKIERKYSAKTLDQKPQNKLSLQREIGWPAEKKIPIVCLPAGMDEHLGGALLQDLIPGLLNLPIELVVLGKGSQEYGKLLTKLATEQSHRVHILKDTDDNRRKMYAAADIALFLSNASALPELKHSLSYGVVPVAPETELLSDYNAVQESGNAFLYDKINIWQMYTGLVRAVETYKFPFDWRTIQRHCMDRVKQDEE